MQSLADRPKPPESATADTLARAGASLRELVSAAEASDATLSEVPISRLSDVSFPPEGLAYQGRLIRLDQGKRDRLFRVVEAPTGYLGKHTPEFQGVVLTEHARRGHFGARPSLVLRGDELVAWDRGELFGLPNAAILRGIEEVVGRESETLSVAGIRSSADSLDVELTSASKAIAVRPGDIVQSGLHVRHERFGGQATLIEAFIYRLVCRNGMTRRECVRNGIERTRKLPVAFPNGRELQIDQIRRLTRQTWSTLQTQLEALRTVSERPAHVEALLTRWLQRGRVSARAMMSRLLAAWQREGGENTVYGAVNALTRVATHDTVLSARQRRVLASLAGLLAFREVHICERCFSVLGGTTTGESGGNQ